MPWASSFLEIALGVMTVTRSGAVFYFLAGVVSSMGSGNGPNNPKTMIRGVRSTWCSKSYREMTLRQLAGRL